MLTKLAVLLASFALSNAVPIQIFSNGVAVSSGGVPLKQPIGPTINGIYQPVNRPVNQPINRPITPIVTPIRPAINSIFRTPSIAFGFGSGFSSDIAGIKHSTSIGSSFSTGDAQAYGSGIGSTGNTYASGIGVANAAPSTSYLPAFTSSQQRYDSYGNPVPDYDNNYITNDQEQNTLNYYPSQSNEWPQSYENYGQNNGQLQSAVSSTQNAGNFQSSTSLAQNQQGPGYQLAISSSQNGDNYRSAISNAQSGDGYSNFGSAISATQNIGNLNASTAQAIQRSGGGLQQSGATIISGPGIQAAQSHAINTRFYRH
ncbi:uncharacterized protein LOC131851836 [Achroia grisella]|uniref:uncharacterized protein LOC131851836 n=1 Tax=Achroia grisella TaxID=688607 RepID=UPI0027D32DCB|nr:uncharacterized protein LOC131851836 [Achroia grisella]